MLRHRTLLSLRRIASVSLTAALAMSAGCAREPGKGRPAPPAPAAPSESEPARPGPETAGGPQPSSELSPPPAAGGAGSVAPSTPPPGTAAKPPPAPPQDGAAGGTSDSSPPLPAPGPGTPSAAGGSTPPPGPAGPSQPGEGPAQPPPEYRDAALLEALALAAPAVERADAAAWRLGPADSVLGWWPSPGGTRLAVTYEAPVAVPGGADVRAVGLAVLDLGEAGPAPGPLRPLLAAVAYGYGPTAPGEAAPALTLTPAGWLDEDRLVVLAPVGGAATRAPAPGEGEPDATPQPGAGPGDQQPVYPWPPHTVIASAGRARPGLLAATAPAPAAGGSFYEAPGLAVVEVDVVRSADRQIAWVPLDSFGDVLGRVWLTRDRQALFLVQGTGLVRVDLQTGTVHRPRVSLPPGKFSGVPEVEPVGDGWRLLFGQQASGPVRLLDLKTGGVAVLTPEGVVLPIFHAPVAAPDGRRFAYLAAEPDRPYVRIEGEDGDFVLSNAVYILDERGTRLARLAPPDGGLLREVAWSPDGKRLVLVGAAYRGPSRDERDWELAGGPIYLGTPEGKVGVLWENPGRRVVTVNWLGPDWLVLYDQGSGADASPRAPLLLKAAAGAVPEAVPEALRGRDFPVPFMRIGPWVVGQGADNRLYRFRPGDPEARPVDPEVEGWILDWVGAGPWLVLKVQPKAAGPEFPVVLEGRYLRGLTGAWNGRAGRAV
ncbi:hypothetical protein [Caldinitratiruptor microaerophilus]|uniref:WD40-like Beta Propeller Repeat n=1 Tax=Caldinitratiruptor microaerophilus TaxID=671077 RepID=A0AA35G6C5_9FIRM|nr:hypothetical protein [Caldinitratiruptor microaerophilus]BDG61066.1 hypothetical protein caldi_21560 [Caldinitratiruptor microaerophilus]